jgi:hypothetical protein
MYNQCVQHMHMWNKQKHISNHTIIALFRYYLVVKRELLSTALIHRQFLNKKTRKESEEKLVFVIDDWWMDRWMAEDMLPSISHIIHQHSYSNEIDIFEKRQMISFLFFPYSCSLVVWQLQGRGKQKQIILIHDLP